MAGPPRTPPFGGSFLRRFTRYSGIYFDEFSVDSAWIRETAVIRLPPVEGIERVLLSGLFVRHPLVKGVERGFPSLEVLLDGKRVGRIAATAEGPWEITLEPDPSATRLGSVIYLRLLGVTFTNALAWAGRVTKAGAFQRFRAQNKNRQLRVTAVRTAEGEPIYDFGKRESPYSIAFARNHSRTGMNVVGFLEAELGLGESARCMVRAADAAKIDASLIALRLNCLNRLGDPTYAGRLETLPRHGVNVIHIDAPAARDIDHHHPGLRENRYNIGYFAWELTEFPDAWLSSFDYFDEIWCPSDFVREAIAIKAPFPVLAMPHSIAFERPKESAEETRARMGLPTDTFLFLCLFDLNSYAARKNPEGALEAFRRAALGPERAALVIKVQNAAANPADFERLKELVARVPGGRIIDGTFSRADTYALEAACDAFVSLHRSEGFGLAVAECMYLGKPVITTGWSATAEFATAGTALPVRYSLAPLERYIGPYTKGALWAEPDIDHAAALMQEVVADPAKAARIGAAAKAAIESRFSPLVIGTRYRRRLEAIASL